MKAPTLTRRGIAQRGVILLGATVLDNRYSLYRAARRLERRLHHTVGVIAATVDQKIQPYDLAALERALDRFAADNATLVTIVPCFYPLEDGLRQAIRQATQNWNNRTGNAIACGLAAGFDQLLDLDLMVDFALQMRGSFGFLDDGDTPGQVGAETDPSVVFGNGTAHRH